MQKWGVLPTGGAPLDGVEFRDLTEEDEGMSRCGSRVQG
jgi:hypothetical protein